MSDPFREAGLDLESEVRRIAIGAGVELTDEAVAGVAGHARAVIRRAGELHLTSILDPREFLERHLAESLAGAAVVAADAAGTLVDLGSGNGYPGLVIGWARPGLRTILVEAATRKAGFLTDVVRDTGARAEVAARQVQRAADLDAGEPIRVLTTRAMGNWERVVPRMVAALATDAEVLIWAGSDVETIARRGPWSRLAPDGKFPLPGRDRAWVWRFRTIPP